MSARVYMLLDILEGKSAYAREILQGIDGVVIADSLEGHPNTLVMIEASNRQKLVDFMMPVLNSIDRITQDLHLLVNEERQRETVLNYAGTDGDRKRFMILSDKPAGAVNGVTGPDGHRRGGAEIRESLPLYQ